MTDPQDEGARYGFGYSDKKPGLTWWIVQAVVWIGGLGVLFGCWGHP